MGQNILNFEISKNCLFEGHMTDMQYYNSWRFSWIHMFMKMVYIKGEQTERRKFVKKKKKISSHIISISKQYLFVSKLVAIENNIMTWLSMVRLFELTVEFSLNKSPAAEAQGLL